MAVRRRRGRVVESDRTISVNNPAAIRAWQRARHWIGWISPPSVVAYRERDSMNVFDSGEAAFNRVWLGTSVARSGPSSRLRWRSLEPRVKTGFASLPGGPGWGIEVNYDFLEKSRPDPADGIIRDPGLNMFEKVEWNKRSQ